jgi:CARDB protein
MDAGGEEHMSTIHDSRSRRLALSFAVLSATAFASACGTPISPTAPEVELAAAAVADEGGKASMSGTRANFWFCRDCPLAMDPPRVPSNKDWTFTAYLANTGDAPAGVVGIDVSLVSAGGRRIPVSESEVAAPRPGERLPVRLHFAVPSDTPEGRYLLEVVVDRANRIAEYDETDNTLLSTESLSVVR